MTGKVFQTGSFEKNKKSQKKAAIFENIKIFLHNFQKQFVVVPIDKETDNFFSLFVKKKTLQRFLIKLG